MTDYNPSHIPVKQYYLVGQKCVVFNNKGQILLLKRSEKSGGGGWSIVGGGLEHGEDPIEGIKREAREETQLEIQDIKPVLVSSFEEGEDRTLLIFYQAKTHSDQVVLNWEHGEYKWVTKDQAMKEELSPALKTLFITISQ